MRNKNIRTNNIKNIIHIKRIKKLRRIKTTFHIQNKLNVSNKYTAVIVEPRKHAALSFVLENFLKNLSNEWNIIIFHGNLNIDFVNNIISN